MKQALQAALAAGLLAATGPGWAGTVEVTTVADHRYIDAGSSRWEEELNLKALGDHLKALGQRHLPAGQTLKVELVEVDLAGHVWPTRRGQDLRVVRGGVDWPRVTLRYTLSDATGKTLASGEDTVKDMNYLQRLPVSRLDESLAHEKRMLREWFQQRFSAQPAT